MKSKQWSSRAIVESNAGRNIAEQIQKIQYRLVFTLYLEKAPQSCYDQSQPSWTWKLKRWWPPPFSFIDKGRVLLLACRFFKITGVMRSCVLKHARPDGPVETMSDKTHQLLPFQLLVSQSLPSVSHIRQCLANNEQRPTGKVFVSFLAPQWDSSLIPCHSGSHLAGKSADVDRVTPLWRCVSCKVWNWLQCVDLLWHSTPKWHDLWALNRQETVKAALLLLLITRRHFSCLTSNEREKLFGLGPTPWFTHMLDLGHECWALESFVDREHAPVVWGLVSYGGAWGIQMALSVTCCVESAKLLSAKDGREREVISSFFINSHSHSHWLAPVGSNA